MSIEIDPTDRRILEAFAANGMRTGQIAKQLYMHRNTVIYHLNRLEKKTGLNAFDFYDLQKLLDITRPAQRCKWICEDECAGDCGNPQCPMAGEKCPVAERPGVCRFEDTITD